MNSIRLISCYLMNFHQKGPGEGGGGYGEINRKQELMTDRNSAVNNFPFDNI